MFLLSVLYKHIIYLSRFSRSKLYYFSNLLYYYICPNFYILFNSLLGILRKCYLSICQSEYISFYQSVSFIFYIVNQECLSIYLTIYQLVCRSIYLSIKQINPPASSLANLNVTKASDIRTGYKFYTERNSEIGHKLGNKQKD